MDDEGARAVESDLEGFAEPCRSRLAQLRALIAQAAPEATEGISYGMPAFFLQGRFVYYAGYARHLGFYPGEEAVARFAAELSAYKTGVGSVRLPHDRPLPLDLIRSILDFRAAEARTRT